MTVSQVNLHQHSEASHLDGIAKFAEIALGSRQLGQEAAVITDHGEVAGHFAFQKACHAEGIHPVLGMEGYWHHDIAAARATGRYPTDLSHIVLLAKDNKGLENLWALSSIAYTPEHFYHRPLADPALLRKYSEGLYASDACMMTQLGKAVERSDEDGVRSYAATLLDVYRDNFYMELHTWQFMNPVAAEGHPDGPGCWGKASPGKISCQVCLNSLMTQINQAKVSTANQLGVPLVVVNDSHHVWAQQWENKDFLCRIKKDKGDQIAEGQKADHLMGDEELYHWMSLHGIGRSVVSEAIANAHRIAMSCTAEVTPTLGLPVYSEGDGDDNAAFLDLIEKGFRRRVLDAGRDAEQYWARIEPEVAMIVDRGLAGYFLIVEDYVRAARTGTWKQALDSAAAAEPLIIGPARGSAGGSLVSYLLGITTVDPIKYGLLFERFLNPGRKGLPDIDTDFPQSKRPDMKAYLEARWGSDHVCTLNTVVRNGPKGMIRDLSKTYDIPYAEVDAMSKLIDQALVIVAAEREAAGEATGGDDTDDDLSWDELLAEKGGDLAPYARKYPAMFEKLGEMVGVARGAGVHPSGILINNTSLLGKTPTRYNAKNKITTTQFDMWDTEALGGVKFDLLGIRHLDTLEHARTLIEQRHGVSLNFDEFDEELRDPDMWEAIDRGYTVGIFQVESPLATRVATQLKPRSEVDVAALISIIRPGVKDAGLMDEYLQRRSGDKPVVYDHPLMKDITEETYGVLVYQEQLILASQELAGWTLSEGDDLRKALGKKLADVLAEMREKFLEGCLANPAFMDPIGGDTKVATKIATKIWGSISAAGRYAFNKCVTSSTEVRLSAKGSDSNGAMSVGDMWRRLNDLAPPRTDVPGSPCRYCGRPSVKKGRGQCGACVSWRMKFRSNHPRRGLKAWSLGEDGRLHPNRIMDVHQNGVQPVWRVTLADGNSITSTANHRHMTPEGWREVWELEPGGFLLSCGEYEGHIYTPKEYTMGDGGWAALQEWTRTQAWVCSEPDCIEGGRIERAHLDGDRTNNHPSNLAMKCVSHHKKYDYENNGRRRRGEKGYPVIPTRIVSIEYVGEEMTYDLEMADPYHSWVGNGIVTHNSHGIGYAVLATWEIWVKHYYPEEFVVALMATDGKNINRYVREARRRNIPILPPDINESGQKFTIGADGIRYGLDTVDKVGATAVKDILAKRPFTDLQDYLDRVDGRGGGNKAVVTNLIKIGAFDSLEYNSLWDSDWRPSCRSRLMRAYHDHRVWMKVAVNKRSKMDEFERAQHLSAWFDKHSTDDNFATEFAIPDFDSPEAIHAIETELVGNFILVDPMAPYLDILSTAVIQDPSELADIEKGKLVDIGGQLVKVKRHKIKTGRNKGAEMAFLGIDYNEALFDVTVFSDLWNQTKNLLTEGSPVVCRCIRDDRGVHLSSMERLDLLFGIAEAG